MVFDRWLRPTGLAFAPLMSQYPILIREERDLGPFLSDENWELNIEH